jgi:hypothetical protein
MMTDNEALAAADCAHTAHPHVSPTAIRNAGPIHHLTDPMLIVRTLEAAPPMSVLSNRRRPGALLRFHSRKPNENATAGCRPLAFRALPHRRVVYSYNP